MNNNLNYDKVWDSMNELGHHADKLIDIRELIQDTMEHLENGGDINRSIGMLHAASILLSVHIDKFGKKFDIAWKNTVGAMRHGEDYDNFVKKFYSKLDEQQDSFYKEQE
jgi:hypothetical protein